MRILDDQASHCDATAKKGLNSVAVTLAICLSYLITAWFSLPLALPIGYVPAVLPASGIAVCAVYILGLHGLMGVAVAAIFLNFWIAFSTPSAPMSSFLVAFLTASASIVQGGVGGLLLRRTLGYPCAFDSVREIMLFNLLTPIYCLIAASISIPVLFVFHVFDRMQALQGWLVWWLGDTMGVLMVLPLLLTLFGEPRAVWKRRRLTVALPMLCAAALIMLAFIQAVRWEELESINYLRTQVGWQSWSFLMFGLLGTALLGAFLLLSSGYTARVELEVQNKVSQLRESEERWQFALEGAGDGVWDIDVVRGDMYLSPQSMAMLGYPREARYMAASEWKNYVHPEDLERGRGILSKCLKNGNDNYIFEFRALTNDGQWRWLRRRAKLFGKLPNGLSARMVGTHTDIHREKHQEHKERLHGAVMEMLARSKRFVDIMKTITDALHDTDHDLIYATFVVRKNYLVNISNNRFSAELVAREFPWNEKAQSCGVGVSDSEIIHVPVSENPSWSAFASFAEDMGITLCWFEPIIGKDELVRGALVVFKVTTSSKTLPDIDHIKHAAKLIDTIMQHKRMEEQLQLIASVYEAISEAIVVADGEGRIIAVNPAFTTITGYSSQEVIGQMAENLRGVNDIDGGYLQTQKVESTPGCWKGEMWAHRKNSAMFPIDITINTIWDSSGNAMRRVCIFSDITERKISEERIQYLATHDHLTALPNRTLFQDRVQRALAVAQRENKQLALLYIDLDHFKPVNDKLGHSVGDQLLRAVAVRMKTCVREADTVARIGGDEFVVLLPIIKSSADILAVAEKIIQKLNESFEISDNIITISASVGVAVYPDDGTDESELSQHADAAMYRAKQLGRNTIEAYRAMKG